MDTWCNQVNALSVKIVNPAHGQKHKKYLNVWPFFQRFKKVYSRRKKYIFKSKQFLGGR